MDIIVGSKNKAKVKAVKRAFNLYDCNIIPVNAASLVSEQPFSDEETVLGAINRARNSLELEKGEIGIGLEGGVAPFQGSLYLCNWGALISRQLSEPIIAGGARIKLPSELASRLYDGEQLGVLMDEFANRQNIGQNEGAIGIFTNGQVERSEIFFHIMKLLIGQYEFLTNINNR